MSLTPAQLEQFHRDGYIIVPDLFSDAEMDPALAAMDQTFYGKPFDAWLADCDAGQAEAASDGFTTSHDHERQNLPDQCLLLPTQMFVSIEHVDV